MLVLHTAVTATNGKEGTGNNNDRIDAKEQMLMECDLILVLFCVQLQWSNVLITHTRN